MVTLPPDEGECARPRSVNVIAWGVAYAAAVTVLPFLRIPGTAGAQFFRFWCSVGGASVMYLLCVMAEAGNRARCLAWYWVACIAATAVQVIASRLGSAWRAKRPPDAIGRSIVQVAFPNLAERPAVMSGELLLCLGVGWGFWAAQMQPLAIWLWIAGVGNSLFYHWSCNEPVPITAPAAYVPLPDGRRVKQIPCQIIDTDRRIIN